MFRFSSRCRLIAALIPAMLAFAASRQLAGNETALGTAGPAAGITNRRGFLNTLQTFNGPVSAAEAAPGDLDTTFSGDGLEITNIGGSEYGNDVAIQADGKVVVVGSTYVGGAQDFALARYNPDGSLDTTFSGEGMQTTDFGDVDYAWAVAIQGDEKIVVVGSAGTDFALARYNADGSLDTTFSDDGKLTTDFGGEGDAASAVALQADGMIVVVGRAGTDFALARYNADGLLDTSFPGDPFPGAGKQMTDFGGFDSGQAMVIQADGKIVVAGVTDAPPTCDWCEDPPPDFALARYNADGTLDTSFSADGKQTTDFGGDDYAVDVALQADNKIVVVGSSYSFQGSSTSFALARYNPDGSLDYTFGRLPPFGWGGRVTTQFTGTDWASGVALQPDGKIVVVGGGLGDARGEMDFAVARYNPDGSRDETFSGDGTPMTDFGGDETAYGVAIEPGPDGKIIAVGYTSVGGTADFGLARYQTRSGASDTTTETAITGGPIGATNDSTPTFSFDSSEVGSTFACRVDVNTFSPCSSPYTTSTLSDGAHTFEVRATDAAGNADPIPASRGFSVDTAPPETTVTDGPTGTTKDSTSTFGFHSSEAGSTFDCRVDDNAFTPCSMPYTTSTLSDGAHTFEVRATDAAGNAEPSAARRDFSVDTAPPETSITAGPTGTTGGGTPAFSFDSSEGGSTFACRVDAGAFSPCNSPHTLSPLTDGSHTFLVRATDGAGNTDATPASRSWTILAVTDYRQVVLATSGLVSYWRLGETSGSAAADAKRANNGTYRNGVLFDRPGALLNDSNASASFDGSNDHVSVADSATLDTGDSFTLEAWVKRSGPSSSARTMLSKGTGSYRLSFVNNVLTLMKGNSGTIARAQVSTTDTTGFHHVVATKSGATVKLYIDGTDRTGTVTNRTIANTSATLNIGRDTAGSEYFAGLIDEVAIYNEALNAAQVQQHFKASGR